MIPQTIINEIISLSQLGPAFKPHKYLALLTAMVILRNKKSRNCRIYYDEEFIKIFSYFFEQLATKDDRNRPYTPFFHLRNTSFWKLIAVPGKEEELATVASVGGPGMLMELVDYAEVCADFCKLLENEDDYLVLESLLIDCIKNGSQGVRNNFKENNHQQKNDIFERLSFSSNKPEPPNPFVTYLNSLHCRDAGSENSLAEFQACNTWFRYIQIPHPLVAGIRDCLIGSTPGQVILTGHAGDGKSTIALELYRDLRNLPYDQPLAFPLQPREDIPLPDGRRITIIKDLSEWGDEQRLDLLSEILSGNGRFLLVSNTGTLLNLFCEYSSRKFNRSRAESESEMLEAISSEKRFNLSFGGGYFAVFNLALLDNLSIAHKIFDRMLSPERWLACQDKKCSEHCPIYRNVTLITEYREIVVERLFMAYRRLYEYGTRLTLRQLTAHLAYILTSGLEYEDILALSERFERPLMSEFMFYNRFFGDNGKNDDTLALQMGAIKEIRKQGFGERPCPTWERQLWLLTRDKFFTLGVPMIEEEFDKLRRYGSGAWNLEDRSLSADQARDQVRRMLYFLYRFPINDDLFIREFLASPAVMKWWGWQSDEARLSLDESGVFKARVFHVLQEQFTGVRLPEGAVGDQKLYITLSRHKHEIRQSAQVVLAQIDFGNEFSLELNPIENGWGDKRKDLCLVGRGRLKGISMPLTLPFLDYVLMRNCGETGEVLHAAYSQRLERLKTQLLGLGDRLQSDDVLLVRLRTNHTFLRQKYAIHNNRLEVANA